MAIGAHSAQDIKPISLCRDAGNAHVDFGTGPYVSFTLPRRDTYSQERIIEKGGREERESPMR